MRIGFAIGNRKIIRYLNDVKYSVNSYTMNRPAIELGIASLSDEEYFKKTVAQIIATRQWTIDELQNRGFKVTDSATNFVFASPSKISAKELFTKLREKGIYVRWWDKPRLRDWLRISVGTDEEMQTLMDTIDQIIV